MNTERLHLLIVEDEEAHIEAIRRAFDAAGSNADIHAVSTLREYSEFVAVHPLDIVLMDLNLPDGRAVDILTHPPEDGPFPIVVMTAFGNQQIVVEVMKAGALDYVVKSPEAFAIMPRAVDRLLREWKLLQERRRAVAILRESEERFHALFEKAPLGYQSLDAEGRFIEVNQAWLDTLGYGREEVIGKWFGDFLAPEFVAAFRERFPLFKAAGKIHSEFQMLRKNGERRFIAFEGRIAHTSDGSFKQTHCILQDITERKRAEEAQRASAAYARSLIEASLDPLVTISAEGKITDVNEASVQAAGVPREKLIGTDFSNYFTEPEKAREGYRRVFSEGLVRDYPLAIRHVSGRVTEVLYNASVYKDDKGNVLGVFAAARDITERKRATEALVAIKERLQNTLNSMTQGYYAIDRDWRVVAVNAAAEKHFGKPAAELIGGTLEQATQGRIPDNVREGIQQVMTSGQPQQFEVASKVRPGTWAIDYIYPFDGGVEVYFTDITERKRAEAALRQQAGDLRARNEELERFNNASVGRELRMIELKQEVNQLCQQVGLPARYPLNSAEESERISDNTPPKKPGQP